MSHRSDRVQLTAFANGKVERSQLTDLNEFWFHHAPSECEIDQRIEEWQFDYNWRRPHGSLGGKTPVDRIAEVGEITPLSEQGKAHMTSKRSESGIANGVWTRPLPSITGACWNSCVLPEPRVPAQQENGHHESETMSVNRTVELADECSSRTGNSRV